MAARLVINRRYRAEPVLAAAEAALREAFAFKRRDFGQDVTESEILGLLQLVEGVEAADLEGKPEWAGRRLVARLACVEKGEVKPAEFRFLAEGPDAVRLRQVTDLDEPGQEGQP